MKYDYKFDYGSYKDDIVSVRVTIEDYGEQTAAKRDYEKFLDNITDSDVILHFGDKIKNNKITVEDWDEDSIIIHIHSQELVDKIKMGWVDFLPEREPEDECDYQERVMSNRCSGRDFDIMYHNKIKHITDAAWDFLCEFDDFIVKTLNDISAERIRFCPECGSSDSKLIISQLFNGMIYEDRVCSSCDTVFKYKEPESVQ